LIGNASNNKDTSVVKLNIVKEQGLITSIDTIFLKVMKVEVDKSSIRETSTGNHIKNDSFSPPWEPGVFIKH